MACGGYLKCCPKASLKGSFLIGLWWGFGLSKRAVVDQDTVRVVGFMKGLQTEFGCKVETFEA